MKPFYLIILSLISINSQQTTDNVQPNMKVAEEVFTGEKVEYNLDEVCSKGIEMTIDAAGFKVFKL